MEIPGLDPGITICKIVVLPIKLYPLYCAVIINLNKKMNPLNTTDINDFLELKALESFIIAYCVS